MFIIQLNSPAAPMAEEVLKHEPLGLNIDLESAHQVTPPVAVTPDSTLTPSIVGQTNSMRPLVPDATDACAVMETVPLTVAPDVGRVIVAVGGSAVTLIIPKA